MVVSVYISRKMENGPKYAVSKEGLVKLIVLLFGCTTFALFADSGAFGSSSEKKWIFAAFIISWSISFLFYFFHIIGLASKMDCGGGCTYNGFDFLWAWISTIHFLSASIAFAIHINCNVTNNTKYCSLQAGSIALGFATFVCYAVEAFVLKSYAPSNAGYIASLKGWFKTSILIGGTATFALLVDSGYNWCLGRSCSSDGLTYALAAFCIAWSVSVVIFFGNMFLPKRMSEAKPFTLFEFVWSLLSCLLFLSGASCFAAFMNCSNFDDNFCSQRLAGVIIGFVTGILYLVEAIIYRPKN